MATIPWKNMIEWPWPDDRLERRTRVAMMYRDIARDADPQGCAELDEAMRASGQYWIVDSFAFDPEHLMTVKDVAEAADVTEAAVRQWIVRWPLVCRGRNDDGRKLYRWGDVLDHREERKNKRAT
jgi:hypothetical protein